MAKQLSLPERIIIERMLHQDYTFASIARALERSASTVEEKCCTIAALPAESLSREKMIVFTNRHVLRILSALKRECMAAMVPAAKGARKVSFALLYVITTNHVNAAY